MEELKELPGPYEILDLRDGESIDLRVERWELGKMRIRVRRTGEEKEIIALRVYVPPELKPTLPHYYDITANTLRAGLLPYLEKPDYRRYIFRITKIGVAPTARFMLEVIPS